MTIVHLSSSLAGGGAEQMVFQLAKKSNSNIKTIVISISNVNTLEHKFIEEGIEIHYLNVNSFKNKSILLGIKKLHSILADLDNVVLHCHQFHSGILGVFYKLFYSNLPLVFTLHTNKVSIISRRLWLFATKPFRKKDIIFSKNSVKWYLKNSEVIPNGVDFGNLVPKNDRVYDPSNVFSFLFLGRLSTPKNPFYLIEAVELLRKNNCHDFVINVVGHGDMHDALVHKITSSGLDSYFNFFGFRDDVKKFLDESHCLILPSLWEGMPVAIIEAAATKLPIIATPVGSIPDFLNTTNASLSSLEHFHEAMIEVMEHYEQALLKSERLYDEIKSVFNIEIVYKQHLDTYIAISKDTYANDPTVQSSLT